MIYCGIPCDVGLSMFVFLLNIRSSPSRFFLPTRMRECQSICDGRSIGDKILKSHLATSVRAGDPPIIGLQILADVCLFVSIHSRHIMKS
jgi:hypothetical protein